MTDQLDEVTSILDIKKKQCRKKIQVMVCGCGALIWAYTTAI